MTGNTQKEDTFVGVIENGVGAIVNVEKKKEHDSRP
jgi:hypothetical protein